MNLVLKFFNSIAFWISWPLQIFILANSTRTRAVIRYNNKIVVVQPWLSDGRWQLPGGGVKKNEDKLSGLVREIKEETGLIIDKSAFSYVTKLKYNQYGVQFSYSLYKCDLNSMPQFGKNHFLEIAKVDLVEIASLNKQNSAQDVTCSLGAI